ncbi:mgpp2cl-1, protein phosphatase 2C-like protein 1 [Conoideocrella luteorostrata]|uniref:Mgpp2cl-1, protein phosphatase 2C-like protein 1 n=1 Tax=Conoideocrella luteorostrata TaxID=1105319 RepID=A0AAJ0G1T1_9HYPO|nr:mgpp2cl-1, protein phosphatase 2C-like protein 1 [Conoideocrella luteorostrata]
MFGGSSNSSGSKTESDSKTEEKPPSQGSSPTTDTPAPVKAVVLQPANSGEKRSGNGSPPGRHDTGGSTDKKRRSSGVGSKASSFLASAKNTLNFSQSSRGNSDLSAQTPLQKLGKQDPALVVPQGQHNNSAGESVPGPKSTFRVGVWEDRNKKCRRTMEDTHAFLYNFLATPLPAAGDALTKNKSEASDGSEGGAGKKMVESDNGYFAIFDGHAGTFAADWCGKKLHLILEETIRKNPNSAIPELLDQTFTSVDAQLDKLPLKNSGCTAAIAVLRWEDRVSTDKSTLTNLRKPSSKSNETNAMDKDKTATSSPDGGQIRNKASMTRQRILYTANVGDARIILCRGGKALRLSYDHKGSDENEGKRIANAGGLILNNRVNGVLAVTRALGDAYMKDLVTGHPYTTETVIQPDIDEFIIIACDGLWDVCSDQDAVDLVREVQDPITASKQLVNHALNRFSTDNLSCMIVRFDRLATAAQGKTANDKEPGAEPGADPDASVKLSEAEKIVMDTKQKIASGTTPAVGVSASNSGRGYETLPTEGGELVVTTLEEAVVEEPEPDEEGKEEEEEEEEAVVMTNSSEGLFKAGKDSGEAVDVKQDPKK